MAKAPRSLAGRVVAITGGARGIGRATAAALIAQGARVAIGDVDAELAERTVGELEGGAIALQLDVTDARSFETFLDQVEARLGPLDVLINNAGIMPVGPFVDETEATMRRMVEINVDGVIIGSKLALARFIPRGRGHLVQMSSAAGKIGFPNGATYCATKHAVVGLSEALRLELRGTGVDISVVMPIGVNTELYSGLAQPRGFRMPEPEHVAAAIVDALRTGRYEVYVPKTVNAAFRLGALVPRQLAESITRLLKGDQVLTHPDPAARAAYDARLAESIATTNPGSDEEPQSAARPETAAAGHAATAAAAHAATAAAGHAATAGATRNE
jgi:NAD(P)-dependent dehydrogenase (short-subunit alcohol dehydrogenase family)